MAENSPTNLKLSVIIPVFNEKNTIEQILQRVSNVPIEKEIIIVDDCSTDGSREIIKSITNRNVKPVFQEKNQGKGAAIRTGIEHATGDMLIIQDADLEYDPKDYVKLLQPIITGEADVVYGSRFLGAAKSMSGLHYFGNKLLTLATNILFGTALTDMETCYKMMKTPIIKNIKLRANRFDFEPEITAKLLKKGVKIKELPINYEGRSWTEGKKITWRDGVAALASLIKFRFID